MHIKATIYVRRADGRYSHYIIENVGVKGLTLDLEDFPPCDLLQVDFECGSDGDIDLLDNEEINDEEINTYYD